MKKPILLISTLLLLVYLLRYGVVPALTKIDSDFSNYYVASCLLLEGEPMENIMDDDWFNAKIRSYGINQIGSFSRFPPVTAFIMLPIAAFEPLIALRVWTIFNIILLLINIIILRRITNWKFATTVIFVLLAGIGLANNFRFGQFYNVLLFLILLGYLLWQQENMVGAALLFSIGMSVKYLPFVFILIFLMNKQWRFITASIATLLIIKSIEIYFFGFGYLNEFLHKIFIPHLFGTSAETTTHGIAYQTPFAIAFQSWDSLFRHIFVYDLYYNPHPLFMWSHGYLIAKFLILILVLSCTVYLIFKINKYCPDSPVALELSIIGLICLVLLPMTATYHFVILIFPMALYLSHPYFNKRDIMWYGAVLLYVSIGFIPWKFFKSLPTDGIVIFASYPRLWIMTILCATIMWRVNGYINKSIIHSQTK